MRKGLQQFARGYMLALPVALYPVIVVYTHNVQEAVFLQNLALPGFPGDEHQ
jgi:hypothetical protein